MNISLIVLLPLLVGCTVKQVESDNLNARRQSSAESGVQSTTNFQPGTNAVAQVSGEGSRSPGKYAADGLSPMPRLLTNAACIRCFYLVNDGLGHHGYGAKDIRSSSSFLDPRYMWPTLEDLRKEIEKISVPPEIITFKGEDTGGPGGTLPELPAGWKMRGLTKKEIKYLTTKRANIAK
jgi:hypothetical protein